MAIPRIGAGSVLILLAVLLFGGAAAIILHSHNRWVAWYHGATYQIVIAAIVSHGVTASSSLAQLWTASQSEQAGAASSGANGDGAALPDSNGRAQWYWPLQ